MALLLDSMIDGDGTGDGAEAADSPRGENQPLRASLRADLLTATESSGVRHPFPGFLRRFAQMFDLGEAEADRVLEKWSEPEAWLPLGSVSMYYFEGGPRLAGAHCGLVRCLPERPFPTHRHLGAETTLMLGGTARDEKTGQLLLPGDVVTMPSSSDHQLYVMGPHECVFALLVEGEFPDFDGL